MKYHLHMQSCCPCLSFSRYEVPFANVSIPKDTKMLAKAIYLKRKADINLHQLTAQQLLRLVSFLKIPTAYLRLLPFFQYQ